MLFSEDARQIWINIVLISFSHYLINYITFISFLFRNGYKAILNYIYILTLNGYLGDIAN